MKIGNILRPQHIFLSLALICGVGVITADNASSQTTSGIRILLVKEFSVTTFKSRANWYKQSTAITNIEGKCQARQNDKFFVSSIIRNITNAPVRPQGNTENLDDYWEVKFEKPLPCQNNQTWFVYKRHVQELRGVLIP